MKNNNRSCEKLSKMNREGRIIFRGRHFITIQFKKYRESFLLSDLAKHDKVEYHIYKGCKDENK